MVTLVLSYGMFTARFKWVLPAREKVVCASEDAIFTYLVRVDHAEAVDIPAPSRFRTGALTSSSYGRSVVIKNSYSERLPGIEVVGRHPLSAKLPSVPALPWFVYP